jgi:cytochrome c biogenesis protein CcmG, thiol:disulfide interchange protein DsbE
MFKNVFVVLVLFFMTVSVNSQTATNQNKPTFERVSRPPANINSTFPYDITIVDGNGKPHLSKNVFKNNGKPTVIAFWLTTCVPCRYELTAISGKFEEWKKEKDFNFYAVSIDFPHNYEAFQKRVEDSKWPFPAYNDINMEFSWVMPGNLNGLPQMFVFDKKGNIVRHTRKYTQGDEDALFAFIKEMD